MAYGGVGADLWRRALAQQSVGAGDFGDATTSADAAIPLKFKEVQVKSIGDRVARVHQQILAGVRDPTIYARARAVLTRQCPDGKGGETWCVPEKDATAELTALFADVRRNVRYTWDPINYDAFQTPMKTLQLHAGDCDDATSLLGAMAMSIGYKVRSRVVQTKGFSTWNHIYLMVQLPNEKWMPLDATVNKPAGWQVPREYVLNFRDFDVPI